MAEAHDMEIAREFDIRVDYTYAPGLPAIMTGHPDNWSEEEPGTIELVAVCIGHVNILPALRSDEIEELIADCQADLVRAERRP